MLRSYACAIHIRRVSHKIEKLAFTLVNIGLSLSFREHTLYLCLFPTLCLLHTHTYTHLRAFGGLSDVWHSTLANPHPTPFPLRQPGARLGFQRGG